MKHYKQSLPCQTHFQLNLRKQYQVKEFALLPPQGDTHTRTHIEDLICGAKMDGNKSQELGQHGCILISVLPMGKLWPRANGCVHMCVLRLCVCVCVAAFRVTFSTLSSPIGGGKCACLLVFNCENAEAAHVNCSGGKLHLETFSPLVCVSCC